MPSIAELLNGKLALVRNIIALIVIVVSTTLWFESRYAKASDVARVQQKVQRVEQDTQLMIQLYKIEKTSRLAVLQLKEARGELTPEQQVELEGLKKILNTINKAHRGEHSG